jgi:hypothetical protein
MMDKLTAMARELALANGAGFAVLTGEPTYDRMDASLTTMAQALLERFKPTGIALLALRREGARLVASINEDQADEPLCPRAFDRVVHDLAWRLLGEVWEGRLDISFTPARVVLTRVA